MSYRLLLPVFLLSAISGYAQSSPPMPRKMAVIDFDRAVLTNTEGVKARGQLEVRLKFWQDQSESLAAKLKALNDKLNQKDVSEAEKGNIRKEITEINLGITRNREDATRDIETRRSALFTDIAERVKSVLKTYSEEQGLAVVFNDTPVAPGPVIFKTDVADITSEIVRRVNADIEKNPIPKPSQPKP
jgi:Skp family chaperone for outer membrane proteins